MPAAGVQCYVKGRISISDHNFLIDFDTLEALDCWYFTAGMELMVGIV